MDIKLVKEILAAHADKLVQNRFSGAEQPPLSPEEEQELKELLEVAERIQSTLRPVEPSSNFEANLERELLTTAHLRQAEEYTPPNPERDLLLALAIIGFIVSLAGLLIATKFRSHRV